MDEIILVDPDPQWGARYEEEAARIRQGIGDDLILRMEHIGSTAIPNLTAKPIIDIQIGVASIADALEKAIAPLEAMGYSYWIDNPDKAHLFLVKGLPPNGPRTHHVHIVELDNEAWDAVYFRDYLRAHPDEAERYKQLKIDLAAKFAQDREAYTQGKGDYVREITARAKAAAR